MKTETTTTTNKKVTLENKTEIENALVAAARAGHFGILQNPTTANITAVLSFDDDDEVFSAEVTIVDVSTTANAST